MCKCANDGQCPSGQGCTVPAGMTTGTCACGNDQQCAYLGSGGQCCTFLPGPTQGTCTDTNDPCSCGNPCVPHLCKTGQACCAPDPSSVATCLDPSKCMAKNGGICNH
jgi:hypothetical protein